MYVDTHTHLGMHPTKSDNELIRDAVHVGVQVLIDVGTGLDNSRDAVGRATANPNVWATVGIHPNSAHDATDAAFEELDQLAGQDRVVALGETGIDYFRDDADPEIQRASFTRHLELAHKHDKAVIVHTRDTDHGGVAGPAWRDVVDLLSSGPQARRVVLHCFSGDLDVVKTGVQRGWYFSYAGNVTYSNAQELQKTAAAVPVDRLLTETDAPYLTPVPKRGEKNEAANVVHTLNFLAQLKNIDPDALAGQVMANTQDAFNL